jgi:hypothetical protein
VHSCPRDNNQTAHVHRTGLTGGGLACQLSIGVPDFGKPDRQFSTSSTYTHKNASLPQSCQLNDRKTTSQSGFGLADGEKNDYTLQSRQSDEKIATQWTLLCVLPDRTEAADLYDWLLQMEEHDGAVLADLILMGEEDCREECERLLDDFYEMTGIAGSFYEEEKLDSLLCRKAGEIGEHSRAVPPQKIVLFDAKGLPVSAIRGTQRGMCYYMDAAGVRTRREIRRMESLGYTCKSLRNELDRAILSTL